MRKDYSFTTEAEASVSEVPLFWGFYAQDVFGLVNLHVSHEEQTWDHPGYDDQEIQGAETVEEYFLGHKLVGIIPAWGQKIIEKVIGRRINVWLLEALEQVDPDHVSAPQDVLEDPRY